MAEQIRQIRMGREFNAEIAEFDWKAIARGWLAKDWKELVRGMSWTASNRRRGVRWGRQIR